MRFLLLALLGAATYAVAIAAMVAVFASVAYLAGLRIPSLSKADDIAFLGGGAALLVLGVIVFGLVLDRIAVSVQHGRWECP